MMLSLRFDKRLLLIVWVALSTACSPTTNEVEPPTEQPESLPEPFPEQVESEPPPKIGVKPPPQKDSNGCVVIQAPGHFEGEGLSKRYVPGPQLKHCDMPPIMAAPPAETAPPVQ
jgi:hypothetical protein